MVSTGSIRGNFFEAVQYCTKLSGSISRFSGHATASLRQSRPACRNTITRLPKTLAHAKKASGDLPGTDPSGCSRARRFEREFDVVLLRGPALHLTKTERFLNWF